MLRFIDSHTHTYLRGPEDLELMSVSGVEGVIICSENSRPLPLVKMAAEAGAHVLCEKPLATTVQDAEAIVRLCRQAGVLLMTAFPMRFSTPLLEVKARLDAGELGQVYCFNSSPGHGGGFRPGDSRAESPARER